ncbi:MAG: hypothetical protein M3P18_22190 [Actinomycetota bacterium]|nr:hypothetical protein [Actinomycetota bacterium]
MSDMDAEFQKVVRLEDRLAAKHATLPRAELEAHLHEVHGIAAATDVYAGVVPLETINEPTLRMQHRRAHELGVGDHR